MSGAVELDRLRKAVRSLAIDLLYEKGVVPTEAAISQIIASRAGDPGVEDPEPPD